jgi:hypothetical protein
MFEGDAVARADAAHARVGQAQRELLRAVAEICRTGAWRGEGARDAAHLLQMRYGISAWKANRWVGAAHALERLPLLSRALEAGEIGIDKALELSRFATPETEQKLIRWAREVSCRAVRERADRSVRADIATDREAKAARFLTWWWMAEDRRLGIHAELPPAEGAVVLRAIERVADTLPQMPGEEGPAFVDARRADALVALCSARLATDPEPDRATVLVHTTAEALARGTGSELEEGPVLHPETVRRLLCTARVQMLVEDPKGDVVALARMRREPPAWMVRQVRYRDRGCRFPGCGTRAFTQAHHIRWRRQGGRTELENLLLLCSFHHRLVHEDGWRVRRDPEGVVRWFRPDGAGYRAGPDPPRAARSVTEDEPLPLSVAT